MIQFGKWLLAGTTLFLGVAARAQIPSSNISNPATLLSPRSEGRGGATVASSTLQDALLQNPAGGGFNPQKYALSLGYTGAGDSFSASIFDTKSSAIGGGVYYMKRDLRNVTTGDISLGLYSHTEDRAGFALFGRAAENLGVGVIAKYAYRRSYVATPGYGNDKNMNGDFGAKYLVSDRISAGVVGQNLLGDETGLNPKALVAAVEGTVASGFILSAQLSRLIVADLSTNIGWGAGAEYLFPAGVALRAGYTNNAPWQQRFVSGGLGYETKSFAVDYSLQALLTGDKSVINSFSLTGFL